AVLERVVDSAGRPVADLVALRIDSMIFDPFDADWLKRAVADVQRDLYTSSAAGFKRRDESRVEMESCGRRRYRACFAREHRLISIAIRGAVGTLDVRRQRHVPDRVDRCIDGRSIVGPEPKKAAPVETALENLTVQRPHDIAQDALTTDTQSTA